MALIFRMIFAGLFFVLLMPGQARDWYVNPETGDDQSNDGSPRAPLATAQIAVNRAQSGDQIFLLPEKAVYRQSIILNKGQSNLTIIGNGVTLTGAVPLVKSETKWESIGPDLHRVRLPATRWGRHLLIVNGKAQNMGSTSGNPKITVPANQLKEGQFRWDDISEDEGWLTVRGSLDHLEWTTGISGFATSGRIRRVKVFNLAARHFLNDGFNIHGDARGMEFFDIVGYECFDEGFSAHDTCQCRIHNGKFLRNENAVADVNAADTYYENCLFADSLSTEVFFSGGRHSLKNCTIIPKVTSTALSLTRGGPPKRPDLISSAVLIVRSTEIKKSGTVKPIVQLGPNVSVFFDEKSAAWRKNTQFRQHSSTLISNRSYDTFPIGRDQSNQPLLAWAAGTMTLEPDPAFRIIHLGKHDPATTTQNIDPSTEWMGLMRPIPSAEYPPKGDAYQAQNQAAHALWRWIGRMAPDAVFVPDTEAGRSLSEALRNEYPGRVGQLSVFISSEGEEGDSVSALQTPQSDSPKTAHAEMLNRVNRPPGQVAHQLAKNYGHHFSGSYIEALALMARLRMGQVEDVRKIALPFLKKSAIPKSGSQFAGSLIFAELADASPTANQRVIDVAELAFNPQNGKPLEAMPGHMEMSDSVFMACPILAEAGKLSGKRRYFDQCVRHLKFMQKLCLRGDGLYRHSPLNEAAWGRGNGFPALGLALVLENFPEDHPARRAILTSLQNHLQALAPWQDNSGMWHQIIDHPDSYAEFTSTCMISYAIARALHHGWIDSQEWEPRLRRSWIAIKARIDTDGDGLVDVCTGTGKQNSLEDYYERKAILGHDDRGGAMALLFATEMMAGVEQMPLPSQIPPASARHPAAR